MPQPKQLHPVTSQTTQTTVRPIAISTNQNASTSEQTTLRAVLNSTTTKRSVSTANRPTTPVTTITVNTSVSNTHKPTTSTSASITPTPITSSTNNPSTSATSTSAAMQHFTNTTNNTTVSTTRQTTVDATKWKQKAGSSGDIASKHFLVRWSFQGGLKEGEFLVEHFSLCKLYYADQYECCRKSEYKKNWIDFGKKFLNTNARLYIRWTALYPFQMPSEDCVMCLWPWYLHIWDKQDLITLVNSIRKAPWNIQEEIQNFVRCSCDKHFKGYVNI